ncbi:MAG: hypothetical protein CL955_03385 [Erythrobacteraceae bacterium]|jgi:hypothetical protein|nr:hypothetical protein [Erythrobacteraceae bacterium]
MFARHLLALFALLSGLAALEAPAHAQVSQSAVQNTRAVIAAGQSAAREAAACPESAREGETSSPRRERRKSWSFLPSWLRPSTVQGSDRALE